VVYQFASVPQRQREQLEKLFSGCSSHPGRTIRFRYGFGRLSAVASAKADGRTTRRYASGEAARLSSG
jgi:hypothetical protein